MKDVSLLARSADASRRLRGLLASWPEPDSLRVLRARELLAIVQGVPARVAALPVGEAGDAEVTAIGHHVAVAEGFLRDHLPPVPTVQAAAPVPAAVPVEAVNEPPAPSPEGLARPSGTVPTA